MFCQNCGSQIDDKAVICIKCGVPVVRRVVPTSSSDDAAVRMLVPVGRSGMAIIAGYFGLLSAVPFVGIISLLLGIFALNDLKNNPEKHGHGRAWFAIIAGAISTVLYGIAFFS